jgi:hypothetical protein
MYNIYALYTCTVYMYCTLRARMMYIVCVVPCIEPTLSQHCPPHTSQTKLSKASTIHLLLIACCPLISLTLSADVGTLSSYVISSYHNILPNATTDTCFMTKIKYNNRIRTSIEFNCTSIFFINCQY